MLKLLLISTGTHLREAKVMMMMTLTWQAKLVTLMSSPHEWPQQTIPTARKAPLQFPRIITKPWRAKHQTPQPLLTFLAKIIFPFPTLLPRNSHALYGSSQKYWTATSTFTNSLLYSNTMWSAWRRRRCVTFLPPPHHSGLPSMANDNRYNIPPPPFNACLCFLALRSHGQGREAAPKQDTHTHLAYN